MQDKMFRDIVSGQLGTLCNAQDHIFGQEVVLTAIRHHRLQNFQETIRLARIAHNLEHIMVCHQAQLREESAQEHEIAVIYTEESLYIDIFQYVNSLCNQHMYPITTVQM